jgi:hypothetical protein
LSQKSYNLRKINFYFLAPTGKPVVSEEVAKYGTDGFTRRSTKKTV